MLSLIDVSFLTLAGLAGGTVNAIAGGASFFTFPAMLAIGVPPVVANASNATALVPASLVAAWAQRRDLADVRRRLPTLALLGIGGGVGGAVLLLATPDRTFMALVPFLLIAATLLFALSPRLLAWVRARRGAGAAPGLRLTPATVALIAACATYGGYFGAGLGIMLLAGLAVAGIEDLRLANALKNALSALVNGVAVTIFVVQGVVAWPATLAMMAGAAAGGFAGARIARRLPQRLFRTVVIAVGSLLSLWYLAKL